MQHTKNGIPILKSKKQKITTTQYTLFVGLDPSCTGTGLCIYYKGKIISKSFNNLVDLEEGLVDLLNVDFFTKIVIGIEVPTYYDEIVSILSKYLKVTNASRKKFNYLDCKSPKSVFIKTFYPQEWKSWVDREIKQPKYKDSMESTKHKLKQKVNALAFAKANGYTGNNDNEADALCICLFCRLKYTK